MFVKNRTRIYFPSQAISYWVRDKVMVMNDAKYNIETVKSLYKIDMKLKLMNFTSDDSRTYKCVAKNSLGESEGDIRLSGESFFATLKI